MKAWKVATWLVSLVAVVAAVALPSPIQASSLEEFSGRMIGANDGDSLWIKVGNQHVMVRCWGVDAPEYSQRYGHTSYQFAVDLLLGKEVKVRVMDRDQYGRYVGYVTLPDGTVYQERLLQAGLAWAYDSYLPYSYRQKWDPMMKKARDEKRGLWLDKAPMPPWIYRKSQ